MIHTGPEIHGDRPELHFYFHIPLSISQKNRNLQNQMEASVAVLLWILYVVFRPEQSDIVLSCQKLSQLIDIPMPMGMNTKKCTDSALASTKGLPAAPHLAEGGPVAIDDLRPLVLHPEVRLGGFPGTGGSGEENPPTLPPDEGGMEQQAPVLV